MDREELKKYLPHREPMLLIDEIYMEDDGTVRAYYTVRGDEFFLQGHYPGHPVVPGVIQCEIMGQASSLLVLSALEGHTPFYTGIDSARFKHQIVPGDKMEIRTKLIKIRSTMFFTEASIYVGETLCSKASLSFMLK